MNNPISGRFFRQVCFLASLVAALGASARAQDPVQETLPNGLTVLVLENHSAPVVAARIYVKTGSIYEEKYLGAGLSHLFEHTLFEGTTTRDKTAINNEIQAIGGQTNAYTSYDVTCYHVTTASQFLNRGLNLLADMVQNATFPEAEVKVQQGVIHDEMNLDNDDPEREISDLFAKTAFLVHPARYPIIGYTEQFDRLTRDDILSYYHSHYTPENSILSVAGDVKPADVFADVEAAFGAWPRQAAHTPALPSEPFQNSPRHAVEEKNVGLAYLQMGWHTIPLQNPNLYALDTLAQILGGGESSRLVRDLQERQNLVSSISAFSDTPNYDAGIFAVRANLGPDKLDAVESAILEEVERIKTDGVQPDELQSAKNQIRAAFIFNSEGVENEAEQMAYDEMGTGDPSYSKLYVERIQSVTADQVKAVAIRYLRPDGLTTAIITPHGTAPAQAAPAQSAGAARPAELIRLPNGVRLIVRPDSQSPTVSIVATVLGGVRLEAADKSGVSNLTANLLTRGTARRSAEQIASEVDSLGGNLSGFSGYNSWGLDSEWLAPDWRRGLTLLSESLLTPTFPDDEVAKSKSDVLASIAQADEDPMSAASILMRHAFYSAHPYGRPQMGTAQSVNGLARGDVQSYWHDTLQPDHLVIAIYGDVDPIKIRNVVEFLFGGLAPTPHLTLTIAPASAPASFVERDADKLDISQAVVWYGYPGVSVSDPDRYAIDVMAAALSGADLPGGRLYQRLRDLQLVYDSHSYLEPGLDGGVFVVYAATTLANRDQVKQVIAEELGKVRDQPIAPEELDRAKSMCVASHAIDLQTNDAQARQTSTDELYGLGYQDSLSYAAHINAVTLADVQRVAQKYLRSENSALAVVEPVPPPAGSAPATP